MHRRELLLTGVICAGIGSVVWAQAPAPAPVPPMDESRRIRADEIDKHLAEGKVLLLDVREAKELEELGTIEGAVHIPLGQLEKRMGELPKDRLILTA